MTTRREFLIGSADLVTLAAAVPTYMLSGVAQAAPALRLANFKALLLRHFALVDPRAGDIDMILVKIIEPKTKPGTNRTTEQFSLVFYASHRDNSQSGTYQVWHADLGLVDMHLSFIGMHSGGDWYRADFNLLVA